MLRTGLGLAALSLLCAVGAGCGDEVPGASPAGLMPVGPCSDVTRLLARYSGREGELCGPIGVFRELIPVGQRSFIARNLLSNVIELWGIGPDGTFGGGPRAENVGSPLSRNQLMISLGQGRALMYEQETGERKLLTVNLAAVGNEQILAWVGNGSGPFGKIRTGRDLLAFGDGHLLLWEPGNGRFIIRPYDRTNETFLEPVSAGTRDEFMHRGHRLIPLGGGRLLEWVAVTGAYRIWEYAFDGRFPDGFGGVVASGTWPTTTITRDHEIMVLDADRLLLWNRITGELDVRELDPLAPDPLAGRSLVRETHERLSALPRDWAPHTTSPIRRVVMILQRGRSFDHHFGRYCTGNAGAPVCNEGRPCCEAMPEATDGAASCHPVDPTAAEAHVPNDSDACLIWKMHDGAMDQFARPSSTVPNCGHELDFACVPSEPPSAFTIYHDLADTGALADHHFPILGPLFTNISYLLFTSNGGAPGSETIMSLLSKQLVPWTMYLKDPAAIPMFDDATHYDARWSFFRWYDELWIDLQLQQLAPFTVVFPPDHEMPGNVPAAAGAEQVRRIVEEIERSPYRDETLVLVAHLTSGGFYDHVRPPPRPAQSTDPTGLAYGPRSPLLALGAFAKRGHISHVPLELSSLTRFVEWNWFGGATGQLDARDEVVNNIGDLLGPTAGMVPSEETPAAAP